jgi:DNA repair exonuclease SbcCD ATPase subunit
MQIESVTARGFGPLAGQTLGLAPGFSIVVGGNESGKSSWHAATFAALCGRRRARGRPGADEQQFIDAHQPWDGGPWAVSCLLRLDDGRQIELRQDLSGKVDCRATDTLLARDVSSEIMVDGSPDASAWLGLTRAAFRATACVGQAEVLRVLEAADGLQHALQRVASTAGASGTAAVAISRLEACRREAVGRDTASAVRPLRQALDAVAVARQRVEAVQASRAEFDELAEQRAELDTELAATESVAGMASDEVGAAAAALRACELRVARAEPVAAPARGSFPVTVALACAAAGLLVAAVLVPSIALGVLAVLGASAAMWTGCRALRRAPSPAPHAEPAELAELRLELAERQALAESSRRRHHESALRASRAEAVRAERARSLPGRAEAEESLAAAERELARVRELDQTLGQAIEFLRRAQERVHREVVPELTALLRAWLPRLTEERYVDVRMDPATLAVEVCGTERDFRRADLLSHGTAEQIYLLLRVALAARLTEGHDSCPLLLDDVTVHADPERTHRMLEFLHRLSAERQIVLFAHQDQVREWAHARFDGERDALIELRAVGVDLAAV